MRTLIAGCKLFSFFLLCVAVVPPQTFVLFFTNGPAARILPRVWFKSVCLIFGITLQRSGDVYADTQTLYVANHLSYLDIPVIGSVLDASFVSRGDVARWPFFGYLAKMGQTAYVARERSNVKSDSGAVSARIERGESLIIFPEGTSTDGRDVLEFKSSLFSLVIGHANDDLRVQPLTLKVTRPGGKEPQTQEERDIYAWHRDMDTPLFRHLWMFAQQKGASVHLQFHPPISASNYKDRKTLAKACHDTVSNGLREFITA